MSIYTRARGIQITLVGSYTQDTAIGLYTTGGVSVFRWIEAPISGTSVPYTTGILSGSGVSATVRRADWRRTGDTASVNGFSLEIDNTTQFYNTLKTNGIELHNCRCEAYEIERNTSTTIVTETRINYGVTQVDKWTVSSYRIPVIPTQLKRNANILQRINTTDYPNADSTIIGRSVPATFGRIIPDVYDHYARFVRTANAKTPFGVNPTSHSIRTRLSARTEPASLYEVSVGDGLTVDNANRYIFPILASDGGNVYWVGLGTSVKHYLAGNEDTSPTLSEHLDSIFGAGYYMRVVRGTAEGEAREMMPSIAFASGAHPNAMRVEVKEYYTRTLVGNETATAEENSWVELVQVSREYSCDHWPCKSFADDTGNEVVEAEPVEAYDWVGVGEATYDGEYTYFSRDGYKGSSVYRKTGTDYYIAWSIYLDIVTWSLIDTGGAPFAYDNMDFLRYWWADNIVGQYQKFSAPGTATVTRAGVDLSQESGLSIYTYSGSQVAKVTTENTDAVVTNTPQQYAQLPMYCYVGLDNTLANTLTIRPTFFNSGLDTVSGFYIYTADTPAALYKEDTMSRVGLTTYKRVSDGLYTTGTPNQLDGSAAPTIANLQKTIDRQYGQVTEWHKGFLENKSAGESPNVAHAFEVFPPPYPAHIGGDLELYIGVAMQSFTGLRGNNDPSTLYILGSRFMGTADAIAEDTINDGSVKVFPTGDSDYRFHANTIPSYYYLDIGSQDSGAGVWVEIDTPNQRSGHQQFRVASVKDQPTWEELYSYVIAHVFPIPAREDPTPTQRSLYWDVREICWMFKKTVSIADDIYSPMYGRVYNDTWEHRKTRTDYINNLADFGEHICRLQNFSENGDTNNTGLTYAQNPLINIGRYRVGYTPVSGTFFEGETITGSTSGATGVLVRNDTEAFRLVGSGSGGFQAGETLTGAESLSTATSTTVSTTIDGSWDHPDLDPVRSTLIGTQILDYDRGWTVQLKQQFCQHAWCGLSIDAQGYESVYYLPKSSVLIDDTITYGDIPESAQIGDVQEPQERDIFCQPLVRYNYNPATGGYSGLIQVTNVLADTYSTAYVTGITGTTAELVWDRCKTLYKQFKIINTMPDMMANKPLFAAEDAAREWMINFLRWQSQKRITIPVYYEKARYWNEGKHVTLTLPHQTNGVAIECVIESIAPDKSTGVCVMVLIMLDDLPSDPNIQDVTYAQAQGADMDVQDTYNTTGESGSTDKDVQDIT